MSAGMLDAAVDGLPVTLVFLALCLGLLGGARAADAAAALVEEVAGEALPCALTPLQPLVASASAAETAASPRWRGIPVWKAARPRRSR